MHPPMNSFITKLLDEDEDETMHSTADVEAITAALNRDIEGLGGQAANAMNQQAGTQVPFGLLLPEIQSQLNKDRAMQLQGLYNRLKSNRIDKNEFVRLMRTIVGEHMIKMALYKLQQRGQLSAKLNAPKSSAYVATSSIHRSLDPNTPPMENKSQQTRLLEHRSDSHGVQHMGFPQSSFSAYGHPSGNYHTGASPNTNMSSLSIQMSHGPVHPIRMQGGGPTHFTSNLPHVNLSSAAGSNAKTPPKKSTVAQKKPLELPHVSSLSKKQKVCGAFSDQSIEQFNDVTAVSGVNLREEEEQLFFGFKEESHVSEATRKLVQEEEERLFLHKVPLQKKVAEIMAKCGVKNKSIDVERCMSHCVEERIHGLITNLIRLSKQRVDVEKPRHRTVITSDIRQQIMLLNQKAREEWEETHADADKLKRAAEVNKEQTTAANVAARAAVGGDDMLLKWQLKAERARQKQESGPNAAAASKPSLGVGLGPKPVPTSERNSTKDNPDTERTSGPVTANCGPLPRTVSVKDVMSVLTREIQMSRSTLIHHLYEQV
ncbi:putative transcription factor Hap3/NF-YB family [Helianthus annuus]|nr:putative transcription factor Hap3/NF-YB family [Helianthus annuus]